MLAESQNLEKFHFFEDVSSNIWFQFKFFLFIDVSYYEFCFKNNECSRYCCEQSDFCVFGCWAFFLFVGLGLSWSHCPSHPLPPCVTFIWNNIPKKSLIYCHANFLLSIWIWFYNQVRKVFTVSSQDISDGKKTWIECFFSWTLKYSQLIVKGK